MSKNKFTILILGIIGVLAVQFSFGIPWVSGQDSSSLSVSPASLSKNVGDTFSLTVKVHPAGKKICAVEGRLVLDKLACQDIEVATDEGIFPQTPPSFSNGFYFLLGIPGCTTQDKTLFTAKVKANTIGKATASFREVDIIGEGVSVSSDFVGGNYEVVLPSSPPAESDVFVPCTCSEWGAWQDGKCGEGDCSDSQKLQTLQRTCTPANCDIEKMTQCVNDNYCIDLLTGKVKEEVPTTTAKTESLFLATISNIFFLGTGNALVGILVGVIIILILVYVLYYLRKKRSEKT